MFEFIFFIFNSFFIKGRTIFKFNDDFTMGVFFDRPLCEKGTNKGLGLLYFL